MEFIQNYVNTIHWDEIITISIRILVILLIALVITKLIKSFLHRIENKLIKTSAQPGEPPSETQKRVETIIRLVKQAALITLWVTIALIILREVGVEVGPLIASAGIIGLAVGFGAQNLVRDVIAGFFIILENQIRVGDVAIINGTAGLVDKIQFRTTVLRDLSGVVHVFPNGSINTLSNMTQEWSAYVFDIGVAYKENTDHVIEIMSKVGDELFQDEKFGSLMLEVPEIFGVNKLDNSAVVIKGRIKTKPIQQWTVGREYLRRVKMAFDAQGVEIPFPHQTIYFGEASKPVDVQLMANASKDS